MGAEPSWDMSSHVDRPFFSLEFGHTLRNRYTKAHANEVEVVSHPKAMKKPNPAERIAFMAGQDDFRAARLRCTCACIEYNKIADNEPAEVRMKKWLSIVDPENRTQRANTSAVALSDAFNKLRRQPAAAGEASQPATTTPRATFPYVKMPIFVDYGLRLRIGPTTFINRNCFILDTPVADITIGDRCQIGPNVTIIGVGHSVRQGERNELETGKAGSWGAKVTIGDGVWIGAGVTVLPGVTIGEYSTIGAGSVVTKHVPPRCVAVGNPAAILYFIDDDAPPDRYAQTAETLEEALRIGREEAI